MTLQDSTGLRMNIPKFALEAKDVDFDESPRRMRAMEEWLQLSVQVCMRILLERTVMVFRSIVDCTTTVLRPIRSPSPKAWPYKEYTTSGRPGLRSDHIVLLVAKPHAARHRNPGLTQRIPRLRTGSGGI